tara:strand:+ start:524 stop:1006 length:483 start_codon:yes stop_codon:yes gene_type:complete
MTEVKKPFSKDEYDKADVPAKKHMIGWLNKNIPDLIIKSDENYGFDIRGHLDSNSNNYFYEVEVKWGWEGEWPPHWKELRIPYRKKRLLDKWQKDYSEDDLTFVVFRSDFKKAWHVPADILLESEVKEAYNKNIAKGEKFFHILTESVYQVDMTYDNSDS